MKKVAILIPVFNNFEFTRKCVEGLKELISSKNFKYSEFITVVIDDGSSDGTGDWLVANHPEVKVLWGDGNLWWSGGVNEGARFAIESLDADYVLLWNDDIIPAPDYFTELDLLLDTLNGATIAGSKIFHVGKENMIWSFGGVFNPRSGVKYMIGSGSPDSDDFSGVRSVDWLPGMGTLVPVEIIRKIGYWDAKRFPQYHGDSDFTFRAKTAGFTVNVYPQLRVWNDKSSSGLTHQGTWIGLYRYFTSIRAGSNIKKNFLFYRRHVTSVRAYLTLLRYYFLVIGGFVKWKLLRLFGVKRKA